MPIKDWARELKRDTVAIYFAVRDPRTPWIARICAGAVIAYAISPIDLIPISYPCSAISMTSSSCRSEFGSSAA